jgi:hypothetical protein
LIVSAGSSRADKSPHRPFCFQGQKEFNRQSGQLTGGVSALTKIGGRMMIASVHRDTGAKAPASFSVNASLEFSGET